jgi:hypothetical protein
MRIARIPVWQADCKSKLNQEEGMAKILCVLYDDPTTGYPPIYSRSDIPKITTYPDGQTAATETL